MIRSFKVAALALVALVAGASAARAEDVDNPAYVSWKSHQPGTTLTFKSDIKFGDNAMQREAVTTLKSVTDAEVTVETKSTTVGGQGNDRPAREAKIPAKVAAGHEILPAEFTDGEAKESGHETIKVGDKDIDCTVYEISGTRAGRQGGAGTKVTGKLWRNTDVPGTMVKMTYSGEGPNGNKVESTTTLSKIEEK